MNYKFPVKYFLNVHFLPNEFGGSVLALHGPRYANMRKIIRVGNGLIKLSGVGDNELMIWLGYWYDPYEIIKTASTTIPKSKAIRPPDHKT